MYSIEDLKIIYVSSRLISNALTLTNPYINEDNPH
jgi:hypothetical protein